MKLMISKYMFRQRSRLLKNQLRLIYASPFTYLMMSLQVSFQVVYICVYKVTAVSDYCLLLRKDLFLWLICIPILLVQHRVSVFSTYYSCISRIRGKRSMISADFITLAVSTCIFACIVLSAPLPLLFARGAAPVDRETLSLLLFLLIRYILLALFVQYIIYSILYTFPNLQKKGGSICVLPFLLYFVCTSPMELLRIKGQFLQILDFSAGGNYVFTGEGTGLWGCVFLYNIHLAAYLALCIRITMSCLSKRWEYLENESICAI